MKLLSRSTIAAAGIAAAGLAAMLALPGTASAATSAYATGNVNMRTCGSTKCGRIATVPRGAPVTIYGCTGGYGWCDTQWGRYRGWVSGRYLQAVAPGYTYAQPIPNIGAILGISILGAAVATAPYYYGYGYPYAYPYPYAYRYPRNPGPYYGRPGRPYVGRPPRYYPPRGGFSPSYPGAGRGPNAPISSR